MREYNFEISFRSITDGNYNFRATNQMRTKNSYVVYEEIQKINFNIINYDIIIKFINILYHN